jgi:hypothetical protein
LRLVIRGVELTVMHVELKECNPVRTAGCELLVKAIADPVLLVTNNSVFSGWIVRRNPADRVHPWLPHLIHIECHSLAIKVDNLNWDCVVGIHRFALDTA